MSAVASTKQYVVMSAYKDAGFYATTVHGVFDNWNDAEDARKRLADGKGTTFLSTTRLVTPAKVIATKRSPSSTSGSSTPQQPLRQATTLRDR